MDIARYGQLLLCLMLFPFLYFTFSLYPGQFLARQEEIKRLSTASSIGFLCLVFFLFLDKSGQAYSRLILIFSWLFTIIFVPLVRRYTRKYCARFPWWSIPCILLISPSYIPEMCGTLGRGKNQDLRAAVLVLDENDPLPDAASGIEPDDMPLLERIPLADPPKALDALSALTRRFPKACAIVRFDATNPSRNLTYLSVLDQCFPQIVLIPDIAVGARLWVSAIPIGRLSGVLLRQNLLDPRRIFLKRALDFLLTLFFGILTLPLLGVIACAVKYDSPGPVLFRQQRIGKDGKKFWIYKFRTMAMNADVLLQEYLTRNETAREEWRESKKLKNDPRITRVGQFLRRTSLDELPQICNILRGEMSLVGPRPMLIEEIDCYGPAFTLYTRVRPGITGPWQVSGRSEISYAERIWLVRHYVCNWSVWLDLLILARTIPIVLYGSGAY